MPLTALLSTQSGAFSFFVIHASLGILTLQGEPPPRHFSLAQWEGGVVGAAPYGAFIPLFAWPVRTENT